MSALKNLGLIAILSLFLCACGTTSYKAVNYQSTTMYENKIDALRMYTYGANYSRSPEHTTFVIHTPDSLFQLRDVVVKGTWKNQKCQIQGIAASMERWKTETYEDLKLTMPGNKGKTTRFLNIDFV